MTAASQASLGFIGGTGPEGEGLALRFAGAGHSVAIGSRSPERAGNTAAAINQRLGATRAAPYDNLGAVLASDIVFLVVPYAGQRETLEALTDAIGGRLVVNVVAPLAFQGGRPKALTVPAGSAAQEAQEILPSARVTAAFHHLSARHLTELAHPLEDDILVCGDDADAKATVMALVEELEALRAIDAGGLEYAWYLESFTALLLSINRRYRVQSGLKLAGL